jgi:AcrR family transcriptional regulator
MATTALRSDAERNRRRILTAAREVIARDGVDATVEAIAQAAEVGMGTLYRRFPTKDELVQAILGDLGETALADVAEAAADPDPWGAFERSARAVAQRFAENRGLLDALELEPHSCTLLEIRGRLLDALAPVVERARDAGVVRADVAVTDVLPMMALVTKISPRARAHDPAVWHRYLGIVLDGLRPDGATPLDGDPLPRKLD